jgi:hypothetical protein
LKWHKHLPFPDTDHNPARYPGGSTYGWHGGGCKEGNDRWWACCHTVKHYDPEIVPGQLEALWDAGHRTLRIPIFWTGEGPPAPNNASQVSLQDGILPRWYWENLVRLVEYAKAVGFTRFLLSSHPVHTRGLKHEGWQDPEWYLENIGWIRDVLPVFEGTDLYVDLLNEAMDMKTTSTGNLAGMLAVMQTDHPGIKFFIGSRGSAKLFPFVLRRYRQMSETMPEGPYCAGLNFYFNCKESGRQVDMLHQAAPDLKGVIVAEATFNDPGTARDLRRSLAVYDRQVEFLCQWGLARPPRKKCDAEHNNVQLPLYEFSAYEKEMF